MSDHDALLEVRQLLVSLRGGLVDLAQVRGDEADGGDEGYLIGGLHQMVDDALAAIDAAGLVDHRSTR